MTVQIILPLIFGILLAGRLPRDRRTGVDELLDTLPATSGGRLAGKFLGAAFATATPIFFFYCIGIVYLSVDRGDWTAVPLGLLAFAAINLPGLLFVGAFSIACTAILFCGSRCTNSCSPATGSGATGCSRVRKARSTYPSRASPVRYSPRTATMLQPDCSVSLASSSGPRLGKAWRASGGWLLSGRRCTQPTCT